MISNELNIDKSAVNMILINYLKLKKLCANIIPTKNLERKSAASTGKTILTSIVSLKGL